MHGTWRLFLVVALATSVCRAQTPTPPAASAPAQAQGTATFVANAEIQAALRPVHHSAVADSVLRVVNVSNDYNVGVSVVRRAKMDGKTPPDAILHHAITEIYQVLEGSGTLVTGGSIQGATEIPRNDPVVRTLVGPSAVGTAIVGGAAQRVGPGDVVIIPPNTAHGFIEITSDQITYLLVRVDSHRVLAQHDGTDVEINRQSAPGRDPNGDRR
jgi:mannose-6-phosphate isomerase-like protein (cupin superfamily)